jgi:hypothetical protein
MTSITSSSKTADRKMCVTLPAMLARMVSSEFTSDAAIRFKIGRRATKRIENQFKLGGQTPGPQSLNQSTIHSVARHPSLNRMATSDITLDATIRASFSGSVNNTDQWWIISGSDDCFSISVGFYPGRIRPVNEKWLLKSCKLFRNIGVTLKIVGYC